MQDYAQPRTTWSGSGGNRGRFRSETPPPAAHISYKPELVGKRFGWVKVISPEKRWSAKWNTCYVLTRCVSCGREEWSNLGALTSGRSKGCQHCSQPKRIPKWLEKRLVAAKQRCENPADPGYPSYGRRGITFDFPSVLYAGLWIMKNLSGVRREGEIDRIDNNRGYAPGNIRFVTHAENQRNKRNTRLPYWDPAEWPYARSVVVRKIAAGMTRSKIIAEARKAVREKRKNWKGIAIKLSCMTS